MRQNSSVGTVLYFVLSTAFHGGMAYALVSVAQMQMGTEGHSETIEFVAANSEEHGDVAPTATEPAPSLPVPAPAQPAEDVVKEKTPAPKRVQKTKAKTKPEPVTELPQKVFVKEEPTNEESVAVASQPIVEAPAQEAAEESLPVVEDEPLVTTDEALTENDVPAEPADEVVVVPLSEPSSEPQLLEESSAESQDLNRESEQQPQVSPGFESDTSESQTEAMGLGADGSTIRSYMELRQVPGNKPPRYPTLARRQNHQGQVQLSYYVQKDGKISDLKVMKSSGYPLLDQEAVRAVSLFQYQAGQEGWTLHPVDFQLQGPVKKTPSRLRTSSRDPKNF